MTRTHDQVAIVAAMGAELAAFSRHFNSIKPNGALSDRRWRIMQTDHGARFHSGVIGIGCRDAETMIASASRELNVKRLLLVGCCGALNPALKYGDIVIVDRHLSQTSSSPLPCSIPFVHDIRERIDSAKIGVAFTSLNVLFSPEEKRLCFDESGADIVEMEGAHLHAMAERHGIQFASLRVVLDQQTEPLSPAYEENAREQNKLQGKPLLTREDVQKRLQAISITIATCIRQYFQP